METQYITPDFLQKSKNFLENEFTKVDHGLGEDYQFSFSIGYYHIVDKNADVIRSCYEQSDCSHHGLWLTK